MQNVAVEKISAEQFLAWVAGRHERFELQDGVVVMRAGAGRRHDRIVVNLTATVHAQVRAGPCQTFTSDTYVAISPTTRRIPDLGVDCGTPDDNAMTADKPALLVEVLSPTTGGFDISVKLAEYQSLASLHYIVLVDTEMPNVQLYVRGNHGQWQADVVRGIDAAIHLPRLNVHLPWRKSTTG